MKWSNFSDFEKFITILIFGAVAGGLIGATAPDLVERYEAYKVKAQDEQIFNAALENCETRFPEYTPVQMSTCIVKFNRER